MTDIQALHSAYCSASGFALPLDYSREQQWFDVWKRGIRAPDITALIALMRWKAKHDQPVRSLKFRSFVGNADYLEEDVVEMRARKRAVPAQVVRESPKAQVLRASGRDVAADPQAKSVSAILPSLFDDFEALKRAIQEA